MKERCRNRINSRAGRTLSDKELKDIEERIVKNKRRMAAEDRQGFLRLSEPERVKEATRIAIEEIKAEAAKEKQRAILSVRAAKNISEQIESMKQKGMNGLDAVQHVLAFKADQRATMQSVETRGNAIANDTLRLITDAFDAIGPKFFGTFTNNEGLRAFAHALYGSIDGLEMDAGMKSVVKKGAEEWKKTTETLRKQYNALGGDVGKLEDWHLPQSHSQQAIAKAGADRWTKYIIDKLDRKRYVTESGQLMNDKELSEFLSKAWETLATGGANKQKAGVFAGRGMAANRHNDARVLHFKDAESWLEYSNSYGDKDIYTTMVEHIQRMASDTALIEILGPNPTHTIKYFIDTEKQRMLLKNPTKYNSINNDADRTEHLYNYVAGLIKPPVNWKLAQGFDTLRNLQVATKLGSAAITSLTDNVTMHMTAQVLGLSSMKLMRNQLRTLNLANRDELRMARRAGLSLQTYLGSVNRWWQDNFLPSYSSKAAQLTVRLSALNAMTEGRRRAFGVTMYGAIGDIVTKYDNLASLDRHDLELLKSKGITEIAFAVWKKAKLEDWGDGNRMLTPDSIYAIPDNELIGVTNLLGTDAKALRRDAALKLLGMINEEVNMAVIEPGAWERALMSRNTQRGTWKGELWRSFMLFKSFPFTLIERHWKRGLSQETHVGKAQYLAAFMAGSLLAGAAVTQIKSIIAGNDPRDMSDWRFWVAAMLAGGSLGIYGDFIFDTKTRGDSSVWATAAGPLAGTAEDFIGLTRGNIMQLAKGEKTNAPAETIRFLKNNLPIHINTLWYTKAVTDHLIFNQLQEMVNPGYGRRVRAKLRKNFGQESWWKQEDILPFRAPSLESAVGNN